MWWTRGKKRGKTEWCCFFHLRSSVSCRSNRTTRKVIHIVSVCLNGNWHNCLIDNLLYAQADQYACPAILAPGRSTASGCNGVQGLSRKTPLSPACSPHRRIALRTEDHLFQPVTVQWWLTDPIDNRTPPGWITEWSSPQEKQGVLFNLVTSWRPW